MLDPLLFPSRHLFIYTQVNHATLKTTYTHTASAYEEQADT